jgi:hypothetical protein
MTLLVVLLLAAPWSALSITVVNTVPGAKACTYGAPSNTGSLKTNVLNDCHVWSHSGSAVDTLDTTQAKQGAMVLNVTETSTVFTVTNATLNLGFYYVENSNGNNKPYVLGTGTSTQCIWNVTLHIMEYDATTNSTLTPTCILMGKPGTPTAPNYISAANVTFQPSTPSTCKLVGGKSYAFVLPGQSLGVRVSRGGSRDLVTGWSYSSARPVINASSPIQFVRAVTATNGSTSWTNSGYTSFAMSLEGEFSIGKW